MRLALGLLYLCFVGSTILPAAQYYVAPGTAASGDGSRQNPWPLQVALTNTALVPGDTIWLRGGTYAPAATNFYSFNAPGWLVSLRGAASNLITFRSYSNEWAKIDRQWRFGSSSYLRFRDLEFYDSFKGHNPTNSSYPNGPWGHFDSGGSTGNEWINCVVHDVHNCWSGDVGGSSIRGCILWYVGWSSPEHVAYGALTANGSFSGNISAWTSGATIELGVPGININSNIMWGSGVVQNNPDKEILMVYGGSVFSNCFYETLASALYNNGGGLVTANGNKIAGPYPIIGEGSTNFTITGNTLYQNVVLANATLDRRNSKAGSWVVNSNAYYSKSAVVFGNMGTNMDFSQWKALYPGFDKASACSNSTLPPDAVTVYLNADEPKRAHIAVLNWTRSDNITVSLSGALSAGDNYQLYSAQNYGAGVIRTGIYNGINISVPMTNLTTAPILYGNNTNTYGQAIVQPPPTSPEFAAFVLVGSTPATTNSPPAPADNLHLISPLGP
jgi:hypothetical protein